MDTASTSFALSRIYAEGWNAARRLGLKGDRAEILNPYMSEPERSRWLDGFTTALT
jgi:ribosome modulation factor